MLAKKCFNTMLETKTCLQPVFPVGHRIAALVWHVEFPCLRALDFIL